MLFYTDIKINKMSRLMDPTKIEKYFKNQKPPKISQLKGKYTDPYFPPNLNSLLSLSNLQFIIINGKL